ncbi:uncharacterized protein Z518_08643 [Rhinocladiella mackenziei CBS 650.93]|uniref:Uncharacterized protein n=1 Tax=Rhinocladiella mackenziei CBS 650.93 TaxID=1442369 RepID=A0A0D2IHB8_9EURO|nr:uncharacterized protein Z518_08643 [Rhinocladiella mackenziei CBS 650.93]KIX02701.1 hypothetical protein Z518_08643 [Rhinocladiella mackenziei CBS 650.93]
MPFHDLNLPYTSNHAELSHTLAFHAELGYSVVAISISVAGKLPAIPQAIPVSSLTIPKSVSTVLTRLTITISDATQNHRLASFQPHYSLIALRPTSEKALQLCCSSLECDLISLDLSQRLPFILKFKTVASALQRGVRFEICYSTGVQGGNSDARRNLISGATALIRATRGRGIVLSSEAKNALGVRGPHDVVNLAHLWGLGQERGKEAICEEPEKVIKLAKLKRTSFRGVIDVVESGREHSGTKLVGEHKQTSSQQPTEKESILSNDMKRKVSITSITATSTNETSATEDKPQSKRETRRAKKARLNGNAGPDGTHTSAQDTSASDFPIKHETLGGNNKVSPKKS